MRRAVASGMKPSKIMKMALWFYGCQAFEGVHPLQGGFFRRKYRRDRRPGLPIESPFVFYPRYLWEIVSKYSRFMAYYLKLSRARARVERDPARYDYTDLSLTPPDEGELDELDIFTATEFGQAAVEKMRRQRGPGRTKVAAAE